MQQRLQKLIASAGIASRRHAEELIVAGHVTVNGKVITELGTKADPHHDHIKVRGRLINRQLQQQGKTYVILHKTKGYPNSLTSPKKRPLVSDLLPSSLGRLHPVGRLDFNTEGLLLMTNDGEFTNLITSARNRIPKFYRVKVKGRPSEKGVERLRRGILIDEGERTAPAEIRELRHSDANSWFEVVLHQGKNQQIRRMFDAIGHSVVKLARTQIGTIFDERLRPGDWRKLSTAEVKKITRAKREAKPADRVRPKMRGRTR